MAPGVAAPVSQNLRYRLRAFGLDIRCEWPLPGGVADSSPARTGRFTNVRLLDTRAVDAEWSRPGERIFEPRYPDGRTRFTIDRGEDWYRLWFEGYARILVAADGTEIACEEDGMARDRRERFLFAQALPLAATLCGFEPLHASAVYGTRGVAAFVGPSGIGKTTLASRLVLRGAEFVTDDVLVLEPGDGAPLTHPGPPFMAVPHQDRALLERGDGRLGARRGESDKLHASPRPVARSRPLHALFHLEAGPKVELVPLGRGEDQRVLASAFAPYLMTSERLLRHLEMGWQVSRHVLQFRLSVPRGWCFDAAVEAVESELGALEI